MSLKHTLSQLALPCSLSANLHQTMEAKNTAVSEADAGRCSAGNDWVELPTHTILPPSPIQATRHNRATNRDGKQDKVGADGDNTARAGVGVNQDGEEITPQLRLSPRVKSITKAVLAH